MNRDLVLAHLTVITLSPPEMVRVAARTGYQAVGLRLIRVTPHSPGYPLMDDPSLMRETRSALRDTGTRVHDIEFVKLEPELEVVDLERFCAAGAELGAARIIAAPYDPDLDRMADRYAALCALAGRYGLGVVLEFFPWTVVPSLADALAIRRRAGAPANGGILVDALHFYRSGSRLSDLDGLDAGVLPFMHLCDGPAHGAEDLPCRLLEARAERLPPGDGALALGALIARMPPGIPISLEVPMERMMAERGAEVVARRVREAAVRLLVGLGVQTTRASSPAFGR
ncbi:xylose isomerase [Gluconacetobacter sacchari DSM 12717]|uniref:Sugar phosphate isomerase/epimerase n=2 Tax=Gluconacetobacter sacchari TaxID=92759 RepID=A0A7W4IEW8_9PROT|nr:TIM barrel protein [Gluconacetobacter sacchari]MBB2161641.1 sugar phosphate isomerase/epimerase [Gluconacetobacter sacchari]GBQ19126.1 xylose isomerase [Gluconacetobacter sacchari DSM 12717]